jgi:preprotein translocase subunit SecE
MQRQGSDRPRAPERRTRPAPGERAPREKVTPAQYIGEVKSELKKVTWPTRREVMNSTMVVLIAVVVMTALIFAFDYGSSELVLFLFD